MALVFAEPVPIAVPSALGVPINVEVALHHAMLRSIPTPLHPAGAASKYLPDVLPTVAGVIKMIPPAGPTSPTAHAVEQGAEGVMAADTADIAPEPREFTAATLMKYVVPLVRPLTVAPGTVDTPSETSEKVPAAEVPMYTS